MSDEKYQHPCGEFDDEPKWVCEVGCYCVGCKNCKNYNGTEYYVQNANKAISAKQRALSGLALKIVLLRLRETNGQATETDLQEIQNCTNEFNRINNMDDEEYEMEELL